MYNEIVSKVRNIARDGLRLQAVNRVRQELLRANQEKESIDAELNRIKLEQAGFDFDITQINDNDPRKELKLNEIKEKQELWAERLKEYEEYKKGTQAKIDGINDRIAKWESGENKVDADNLQMETSRLLQVVAEECAKNNTRLPDTETQQANS